MRCALSLALLLVASPAWSQPSPDEDPAEPRERRDGWSVEGPYALEVHLRAGASLRLDEPPRFEVASLGGGTVEAGLDVAFSRRVGLGLRYSRLTLASEDSGVLRDGQVELARDADALWLLLRLAPLAGDGWSIPLYLGPSVLWQHVDAQILAWDTVQPDRQVATRCGGTGMGFGVRGAVGAIVDLAAGLHLTGDVGLDNLRITDEVIGGCAPGAGTATVFGARLGLGYRFSLDE